MATRILSNTEPPELLLDAILEGAEFTLYRAREHGNPSPILVVAPTAEQPLPQSLRRLEHEYSLAAELEPVWAARPLALRSLSEDRDSARFTGSKRSLNFCIL